MPEFRFKYEDDDLVPNGSQELDQRDEITTRIEDWIASSKNYLAITYAGDETYQGPSITVSRRPDYGGSYVWICTKSRSAYAIEEGHGDETEETEEGIVPRKYFLSDTNAQAILIDFIDRLDFTPSFHWDLADVVATHWW
ncbi:MAG: hypothetical protein Q7Q71_10165 [Verrucomicrobiota bacterium JB023]|nr:hypothetical protein [Verrucomicrobiota bacterium JB023]